MINDELARDRRRYTTILVARAGGVLVMLVGLLAWHTGLVREGGAPAVGLPVFAAGVLLSLVVPQWLARRWRTPPQP